MKTNTARPYSLGFQGHAKSCDCHPCAKNRAEKVRELWLEHGSAGEPKVGATVFVRSHFRRQHNHLNAYPESRRVLAQTLARIGREKRQKD